MATPQTSMIFERGTPCNPGRIDWRNSSGSLFTRGCSSLRSRPPLLLSEMAPSPLTRLKILTRKALPTRGAVYVLPPREGTPTVPTVSEGHPAPLPRELFWGRRLTGEDTLVDLAPALPRLDLQPGHLRPRARQRGPRAGTPPVEGLPEGVGDPLGPGCRGSLPLAH